MIRRPPMLRHDSTDKERHSLRLALAIGTSLGAACLVACGGSSTPPDLGPSGGANSGSGNGNGSGSTGSSDTSGQNGSSGNGSGSLGVSTGSAGSGSAGSGSSGSGVASGSGSGTGGADAGDASSGHADAGGTVGGDSGGLVPVGDGGTCPAPAGVSSQVSTALQIINQTRAAMGSPCATDVAALNTSAAKHCQYYAANISDKMNCDANPHVEVSGCTDYVAAQFNQRESMAGYSCQPSATQGCSGFEVMAFNDNPTAALAQWIGSIYHRTPVLDPRVRDFGYGSATGCDTIDFGEGAGGTTPANVIVSYPYDGQTGVGLSFYGSQESPMPPVPPNGWPSALPITIFLQATSVTLTTDQFGIDGGQQLAHQVMTPQSAMGYLNNALVLYGNVPLTSKTKYRVHVAGTRSTQGFGFGGGSTTSAMFDVSFAFTTM